MFTGWSTHEKTHVDRVDLLVLLVVTTIGKGCALTAKDEAVWEKTQKDGFGEVHDGFSVYREAPAAQVEKEPGE